MLDVLFANSSLFVLIGVVASLMIGNTLFKLAACSVDGSFNLKILLQGLEKYFLILLGLAFVIMAGAMVPEMTIVTIDKQSVTILQALNLGCVALIYVYGKKCLENLAALFEVQKKIEGLPINSLEAEEDKG